MKNKNIKLFSFLLAVLVSLSSVTANATETISDGKNLKKTCVFETKDPSKLENKENEEFPEVLKEGGVKYRLKKIVYEVIDKKPVTKDKKVTKEIQSELIPNGQDFVPEQTMKENGVTYKYVSHTPIEDTAIETVTGFNDYDKAVTASDVPSTKTFPASDGTEVTCSLTGIQQLSGVWEDTFIDITFVSYDADVFVWNGHEVTLNDAHPLQGYESQLLDSVGANANEYRINNISWNGDPYMNNGVLCRNARASVQKFVRYYRANYQGEYQPGTIYKVVYTGMEKVESETEFNYEMKATAEYTKAISTAVMVGIGIMLLIVLIILILFILSRKKKEKNEEE